MDAAFFTASEPDKITEHEYIKGRLILDEKDRGVVDWVYKNNKTAGLYTNTLPRAGAYFIPLSSTDNIVGVIALRPESFSALSPEIENFIQNVVFQIAMHIEHEILSQNNRKSLMIAESERLYKVLLNTISHELRTPLTAISGASSCLLDDKISENIDVRKELSLEIHKAADRLNHLVDNLLDMSRLESGMLKLNKKLNDIGELISVSVRRNLLIIFLFFQ